MIDMIFFNNTFKLSDIHLERIRKFLSSSERSQDTHNINKYWLYRRMKMEFDLLYNEIKIKNDTNLSNFGESELRQNNSQKFIALNTFIERNLRRIVQYGRLFCDKVEKKYEQRKKVNNLYYLKSTLENRSEIFPYSFWNKTPDPLFTEPICSIMQKWPTRSLLMLRALDIINNFSIKNDSLKVLEIGSGPAILAGLMMHKMNTFHILIDLPEQIVIGFSFLSQYFPEKKILLPHEVAKESIDSANVDVIFITPEQMNLIKNMKFDIAVNMFSFQEMSYDAINEYFKFIRTHSAKNSILYCINRLAKFNVHDGAKAEFDKYPWTSDDVFIHEKIFDGFLGKMPIGEGKIKECVVNLK